MHTLNWLSSHVCCFYACEIYSCYFMVCLKGSFYFIIPAAVGDDENFMNWGVMEDNNENDDDDNVQG